MAVIQPVDVHSASHTGIHTITWTAVTVADTGAAIFVGDCAPGTQALVVHNVGLGTPQLRGSNDGVNFVNLGAVLAANSITVLTTYPAYIDVNPQAVNTSTIVLLKRQHQ